MDRENKTLQKPKAPDVIPGNIPDIMKNTPSWVLWKYENRDGKYSKIPYFYNHAHNRYERASSDNAGTWGTFEEVYTHYKKSGFDGIGFVFYDKKDTTIIKETKWGKRPTLIIPNGVDLPDISFSGMDIDHVINKETGVIDEKAAEIIEKLNTYTEFSPSGTGTHSYCIGPFKGENLKANPFEFYYHTRFFTVTGNIYGTSRPIREGGEILQSIVGMIREERDRRKAERNASTQGPSCQLPTNNHAQHSMGNSVSNGAYNPNTADEVIETIRNHARGKQASLFSSLYDRGEINAYGNDKSAADMALMNILPFWCNGNPDLMESVFSLSSLGQREKWKKRPDYRKMTIEKALASWNGKTFNPPRDRGQGKEETGNALFQLEKIPPGAENSMHWPDIEGYRKVKNEKGEKVEIPIPRKTSPQNMAYFLKRVGIKARYNLLSKKAEYTGPGAVYYNPAGKRETLGEEVDENAAALTLRVNAGRALIIHSFRKTFLIIYTVSGRSNANRPERKNTMNYGMTEDAKKVKNEVNNEIIAELENGGGKFVDNMESLKGPLYNATTGTQIQDKKAIEIMTQAEGLEDQRFMTGNQAIKEGVHIREGAKAVRAINFSAEAEKEEFGNLAKDENGNVKGRMMGRTYKYFNAKDLDLGDKGKGDFQYKDFEKTDIETNLAQRMAEMHKSREYTYERAMKEGRTDVTQPMPLPEVDKYRNNREGFYNAVTEYAVKNTLAMGGNKDLEQGEYLQGKEGKPGERKVISKTEKAARTEFRTKLGAALINREMGLSNKPFKEWISKEDGKKLAKYYKEHPEKLNHDINASVKAAANVKEKVMFLTRTRKTREQIQKMENDFHADAANQGKSIPASHYYDYAPINVQKMEERLKADPQFKDMATRNQINKALSRSMKTLDTQIKSIENEFGNTVTMSKFLENKISETRKKLGLESDPRKYMKDYHENTPVMKQQNDGKMRIVKQTISFTADMDEIRKNNMSQEEIINKFANGKEGREGLDIVKEVKKNETEKTIAKTEEYMKNQAGKWAQENAQAKAMKKADWKARMAKAAEKTNTMNMSKAKSKSHSRKNAGRDDR